MPCAFKNFPAIAANGAERAFRDREEGETYGRGRNFTSNLADA